MKELGPGPKLTISPLLPALGDVKRLGAKQKDRTPHDLSGARVGVDPTCLHQSEHLSGKGVLERLEEYVWIWAFTYIKKGKID